MQHGLKLSHTMTKPVYATYEQQLKHNQKFFWYFTVVRDLSTRSMLYHNCSTSRSDYPLKRVKYENKMELLNGVQDIRSNSNAWQNQKPLKASTPQAPAPDPYEFSDDSSINPASISRSSIRNSRDDLFHRSGLNKGVSLKVMLPFSVK